MQTLSNEDFLESEDYWKDNFTVKFIRINEDNTEWWKVFYKNRCVSCTSMLMAFKIANTAQEVLDKVDLSIDHRHVINKVSFLVNVPVIKIHMLIPGNYLYGKTRLPYSHKEVRFYKCPKCGIYDIEMDIEEPDITECIKCNSYVNRTHFTNKKNKFKKITRGKEHDKRRL